MNEFELKSCPFCGTIPTTKVSAATNYNNPFICFTITCPQCEIRMEHVVLTNKLGAEEGNAFIELLKEISISVGDWNSRKNND